MLKSSIDKRIVELGYNFVSAQLKGKKRQVDAFMEFVTMQQASVELSKKVERHETELR